MKKVDADFNFIEMEHNILNFWEKEQCFKKLQEKNKDGKPFRFLDGPIQLIILWEYIMHGEEHLKISF